MPKYILKEMPDMQGEGKRRVYPKLDAYELIDTEKFIKEIHSYQRAIAPSVIEAVLTEMSDVLRCKLSEGHAVKIDDLGTFSLSLTFNDNKATEIQSDDDDMMRRHVEVSNVNFKAAPTFLKQLKMGTHLERKESGVNKIIRCEYTRAQRIENALNIINSHGFITLTEYAKVNSLCRTYASQDLSEISSDPTSPIKSTGKGSHKVWVKRRII